MIIAGGTYNEQCQFPLESDFFGSGLRAALATESLVSSNELHTCIGRGDRERLNTFADTFDFDVHTTEIPRTATFDYLHNHSNPRLIPTEARDYNRDLSAITGDAVLRFGIIEGTAVVSGKRVVYDPQDPDPTSFEANGSTAEELALVLNYDEALELSGENEFESIFDQLHAGPAGADVVVIKRGARGALLSVGGQTKEIPVYQTESVWGIGSGDVFSAVFAAEWANNGESPVDAAEFASKATAYYCRNRQLGFSKEMVESQISDSDRFFVSPNAESPSIYLAGPFFDVGELYTVEEVKSLLESEGADVFSPFHDIGRAGEYDRPEEVAQKDLDAIDEADLVFALLDHLDSGTQFELGYARKADIPVVGYATDCENLSETMILGSGCEMHGDLSSAVFNAIWRAYA